MRIDQLNINGFGKFNNKMISLEPGLNVIYGPNEAGKTTLWNYIIGMMFGIDKARGIAARKDIHIRYQPLQYGIYGGSMDVTEGDMHYRIQRNFDRTAKETKLYDLKSGNALDTKVITNEFFGITKEHYMNTLCIGQNNVKYGSSLKESLTNHIANLNTSQNMKLDVSLAVSDLTEQKRKLNRHNLDQEIKNIEIRIDDSTIMEQKLLDEIEQEMEKLAQSEIISEEPARQEPVSYPIILLCALVLCVILGFIIKNPVIPMLLFIICSGIFIMVNNRLKKKAETFLKTITMVQLEKEKMLHSVELKQNQLADIKSRKEELEGAYQKVKKEKADILYHVKCIELAIASIHELSNQIHNDFGTILNKKISKIVAQVTDNRYTNLKLDDQLGILVEYQNQFIGLEYLSTGTTEQIYLATRLAVGDLMNQDFNVPLMIDDIFGNYDNNRLEQVLTYLSDICDNQIILFTCKEEIKEILDMRHIRYSYISL